MRSELVQQSDVSADVHPVSLNRTLATAVYNGVHAQQPAANVRLAQPDGCPFRGARTGLVRPSHMSTRQIEIAADPDAVRQQSRQPTTTRQRQLIQLRPL